MRCSMLRRLSILLRRSWRSRCCGRCDAARWNRVEKRSFDVPLQRDATRGAINDAAANTADRGADIEQKEGVGHRVDDPCDRDQDAAATDHYPRTELVDQIAFERNQPTFGQDEECVGD